MQIRPAEVNRGISEHDIPIPCEPAATIGVDILEQDGSDLVRAKRRPLELLRVAAVARPLCGMRGDVALWQSATFPGAQKTYVVSGAS